MLESEPCNPTGRRNQSSSSDAVAPSPAAVGRGRSTASGLVAPIAIVLALATLVTLFWEFITAHQSSIHLLLADDGGELFWRLLLAIAIIVITGWFAGRLVERFGQPRVIGEIFMGILLGPTLFGQLAPKLQRGIFRPELMPYLSGIASVGVAIFMFLVGFEVSFGRLRAAGPAVGMIGFSMIMIPVACGMLVALLLAERYRPQAASPSAFVLFIGVAMGNRISGAGRVLRERGLMESRLGTLGLVSAGWVTCWRGACSPWRSRWPAAPHRPAWCEQSRWSRHSRSWHWRCARC